MHKVLAMVVILAAVAPAQRAAAYDGPSFEVCARAQADMDNLEREWKRLEGLKNPEDQAKAQEGLAKLRELYPGFLKTTQTCADIVIAPAAAKLYCSQARYKSDWCDRILADPRLQALLDKNAATEKRNAVTERENKELEAKWAATEGEFKKCAKLGFDFDFAKDQYATHGTYYQIGTISYDAIHRERLDLVRLQDKLYDNCQHAWELPLERVQGICNHPAYRSRWCSRFN